MEKLAIAALFVLVVAAAAFVCGPYILEGFVDKLEEWEEIMDASQDEK